MACINTTAVRVGSHSAKASVYCEMFQKAVLLLALVAILGSFLFAEGQEFGG